MKLHQITIDRKSLSEEVVYKYGDSNAGFRELIQNAKDAILDFQMLDRGLSGSITVNIYSDLVEVTDNGIGMNDEIRDNIFNLFYSSKGKKGTGLGLFITRNIIQQHGGTIEVISKAGKGSVFTIKLPAKGEKAEERIAKDEKRKENRESLPLNILTVDDEEEICKMFMKWLSLKGLRVKSASTGKRALQLVNKEKFDFVFLDIIMPGIPSIEVLEKIRKISPKTSVIMMSGKLIGKDLLNELKQKGASGFLQKPFKIEDIMRAIKGI